MYFFALFVPGDFPRPARRFSVQVDIAVPLAGPSGAATLQPPCTPRLPRATGPHHRRRNKKTHASTKSPLRQRKRGEHSVGKELLVARQADDGGAGELLRRHRGPRRGRGVGQVPRGHGLEEPFGAPRARQRGDDVDEAQRPERDRGPAGRTSSMACAVRRRWRDFGRGRVRRGKRKGHRRPNGRVRRQEARQDG